MRLTDINKPYHSLSYDEKMAIVLRARDNKYRAKPAKVRHEDREEKAVTKKAKTASKASLQKTITQLTPEQRALLIQELSK